MSNIGLKGAFFLADTEALDADGVCTSQTPASGGSQNLTIDGALSAGGSVTNAAGRIVTIASLGNDSARTFTVTGTDLAGNAQTETFTGPNATTVTGTKYFKTITVVNVDNDTAGAITVGINNSAADVVFAGSCRVKGFVLANSATAGTLTFKDTSATGTTQMELRTVGSATVQTTYEIPEGGVFFTDGAYVQYTGGGSNEFGALTVFYG